MLYTAFARKACPMQHVLSVVSAQAASDRDKFLNPNQLEHTQKLLLFSGPFANFFLKPGKTFLCTFRR